MIQPDVPAERLRIAPESSASQVARRCVEAYFNEVARLVEGGFDPSRALASLGDDYAPPKGAFFAAWLDGEAVGCGALVALDAETGEIKRVWTAPAARGLGVAKAMMAALEAEARARGHRRLRLDTNRALTEARAMYLRLGYREIGRYNQNPHADHWFEKGI